MAVSLDHYVVRTVMRENNNNTEEALADLAGRFVQICGLLDRAERLYSRAYAREGKPTEGAIDDPVNPITDDWIATGKEPADA